MKSSGVAAGAVSAAGGKAGALARGAQRRFRHSARHAPIGAGAGESTWAYEESTKEEATGKFNELSRTIVNKMLTGAVTICQELTMTEEKKYIAYLAIELSGGQLADAYVEGLQQEERIRAEYNYDQFKETFEEVMSNYRNQ